MKKMMKRTMVCCLVASICWTAFLMQDRRKLREGLIRFHVVAHSDRPEDQAIKYQVRDRVIQSLQSDLQKLADMDEAKEYLQENLPKLQTLVDETLEELGFSGSSVVTLCKEAFDVRHYDTFSLPAGVYHSLRIVIGDGQGRNWWCVSFPTLCIPATASGFTAAAVGAGFSDPLIKTLSGEEDYEIRFYLLDQLGKLENIFFQG